MAMTDVTGHTLPVSLIPNSLASLIPTSSLKTNVTMAELMSATPGMLPDETLACFNIFIYKQQGPYWSNSVATNPGGGGGFPGEFDHSGY